MKLLTVPAWLDRYFDAGSRPSEITAARWVRNGKVPARKVGGTWFVDEEAWKAGDDALVHRVLDAG